MRADEGAPTTRRPRILCAGIAVLDQVFRLSSFPERDGKTKAVDFVSVVGGGAANAAIAVARLGGVASFAGPLGDRANDPIGDRILAGLTAEGVTCACVGVDGVVSPVSAILVDAEGGRTIIYHRDPALNAARVADPDRLLAEVDGVLAEDHCPALATPICAEARRRGLPVVLDVERKAAANDPLLLAATHRIFSRAGLAATTGLTTPRQGSPGFARATAHSLL